MEKSTIVGLSILGYLMFVFVFLLVLALTLNCGRMTEEEMEAIRLKIDDIVYQLSNGAQLLYCPECKEIFLDKLGTTAYDNIYNKQGYTRKNCPLCNQNTDIYGYLAGRCLMPNCSCGLDSNLTLIMDCLPWLVRTTYWFNDGAGIGYCIQCGDTHAGYLLHTPRKEYDFVGHKDILEKIYKEYFQKQSSTIMK